MRLLDRFSLVISLSGLLAGLGCGFSAGGDAEGPALLVQSGTITGRVLDNGLVASVRAAAPMGNLIVSTWGSMISKKARQNFGTTWTGVVTGAAFRFIEHVPSAGYAQPFTTLSIEDPGTGSFTFSITRIRN
ncbi:MAG TPA: hypothetical protein PLP29_05870 [Candidatus Ozemobacteraceae bacterium]|nr:hypothetical protein [Candidatus Ozemobacteraceae bacterium]